ncbi:molybdenum cofactor sulfurase [Salipiger pallidus]|uniref:Molybdenum cofactor sulfurase n=1 Tax=Salipiger pallidus TaxID=1775170 RepID=A0A8J2ZI78_9RHOB|nr:MOSC domain-containing protein [Salipiger pallidus]GGG68009.1 molybdenum cofactor sulfurase [Salipiger pallidus]
MPALKPTPFKATVRWLGQVPPEGKGIRSTSVQGLEIGFEGPVGERHSGLNRPSCSRVTGQHPKGTEIRNTRQLSLASAEEMAEVAATMGLTEIEPEWLGATVIVEGIGDFSHLPPSSRLQGPDGLTLIVDMENRPCHLVSREIEQEHEGIGGQFRRAAAGKRGITASVERPGRLSVGDELVLHIPDQPVWAHLDAARKG